MTAFRNSFVGLSVFGATMFALYTSVTSLTACGALDNTSPLPPTDASDLDAGQPPPDDSTSSSSSSSGGSTDSGPPAVSARVRLANLLQGPGSIDLCGKVDANGTTWQNGLVTANPSAAPKPDGLDFGQMSQSIFLSSTGSSGTKYLFEAVSPGADCNDNSTQVFAKFVSTALKPGGGVTLVAVGLVEDGDAGDATPRGAVLIDTIAPSASASLFRVFHGVQDMGAFDVSINGAVILQGVKYATAFPYPYSTTSGFASVPAGVPDNAQMQLNAGTTVRNFTIPTRLRRGIATTILVGGTKDNLDVQECADRSPDPGAATADCTKLAPQ